MMVDIEITTLIIIMISVEIIIINDHIYNGFCNHNNYNYISWSLTNETVTIIIVISNTL